MRALAGGAKGTLTDGTRGGSEARSARLPGRSGPLTIS